MTQMSSQFSFKLATVAEDSALRAVLRQTSMQGRIQLSFQREPNFFIAEQAGNIHSQVIAVTDEEKGCLAGFGCRSFKRVFVDGKQNQVGYLSGLRALPEYRAGTLLVRGYKFLKTLHKDKAAPYYFTTILCENQVAKNILTSKRAGLPTYQEYAKLSTFLLPLYRSKKNKPSLKPFGMQKTDLNSAVTCINKFNQAFQFASVYSVSDFLGENSLLPAFKPAHLYGVKRNGQVVATLGIWDQQSFKQSVVAGYSPALSLLRPASNLLAKAGLTPYLPKTGEVFPYLHSIAVSYLPGHYHDFFELLEAVTNHWSNKGYAYLSIGVDQRHPLAPNLKGIAATQLLSTLYLVYWNDDFEMPSSGSITHVEVATL